jgi:hypothetical protein
MSRVVLGLAIGFTAVFGGVVWVQMCLPDPYEEQVEWVQREDAIVVQMKVAGGMCPFCWQPTPEFTLYGDGTLIIITAVDEEEQYVRSELSREQVADLLERFDDTGFFSFNYEVPGEIAVLDAQTTYMYASSRDAANAVSAYALGLDTSAGGSDERKALVRLAKRLEDVINEETANASPFIPDQGILTTERITSTVPINSTPWPYEIDITSTERQTTRTLAHDELLLLGATDLSRVHTWLLAEQDGEVYHVRYRPALPYEENFPEFDPPE